MKLFSNSIAALTSLLFIFTGMTLLSCGTRNDGAASDADTTKYALATEDQNFDDATDRTMEADFNGKHYVINIKTAPSDSLPTVKNQFGDDYKDNVVTIKVTTDNQVVMERTFTKANFSSYLQAEENQNFILGGMAYNEIGSNGYTFEAMFNKPQDEEGGSAFKVVIPLGGGSASVSRDTSVNADDSPQD